MHACIIIRWSPVYLPAPREYRYSGIVSIRCTISGAGGLDASENIEGRWDGVGDGAMMGGREESAKESVHDAGVAAQPNAMSVITLAPAASCMWITKIITVFFFHRYVLWLEVDAASPASHSTPSAVVLIRADESSIVMFRPGPQAAKPRLFGSASRTRAEPTYGPEPAFGPAWHSSRPRPSRKAAAFKS
ncbi:hypothetical protein C8R45DRAFT_920228 [Mycena sanguinolenta]|nr:hypothetical protein C8R45DRAFT_920228 [Mycena sanguinolenta]